MNTQQILAKLEGNIDEQLLEDFSIEKLRGYYFGYVESLLDFGCISAETYSEVLEAIQE